MTNEQKLYMDNTGDLGILAQAFEKAGVPFNVVSEFEGISIETNCGDDMIWSFRSYGRGSGISPVQKLKDPLHTNHASYPALKDVEVIRTAQNGRVAVKLSGTVSGKYTEIMIPGTKPKSIFLRRDRRNLDIMIERAKAYDDSPLFERFVEDLEKARVPGVTVVIWYNGDPWLCVEMNDGVTTFFLRPCRSGILGMRLDEPLGNSPITGFPQLNHELFTFEDADEHGGRNFVKLRGRHLSESEWECLNGNGVLDERDRTFDHELVFAGASSAEGVKARRAAMKVVALLPHDTLLRAVYTEGRVSEPMPAGEWSARWLRASDPCYEVHCWTMGDFLRFELA